MDYILAVTEEPVSAAQLLALDPGAERISKYRKASLEAWGTENQPEWGDGILSEALWLCQANLSIESSAELLIEHETGCYVAIATAWAAYLDGEPNSAAGLEHLYLARQVLNYVRGSAGAEGREFIERTIRQSLSTMGRDPTPSASPSGLMTSNELLAKPAEPVKVLDLLTTIRDAWVEDPGFDGTLVTLGYDRSPEVDPVWPDAPGSASILCARGFKTQMDSDTGFQRCSILVFSLWRGYLTSGSPTFKRAMTVAYQAGLAAAKASSATFFTSSGRVSATRYFKQELEDLLAME